MQIPKIKKQYTTKMAIDTSLIKGAEFAATGGSPTGGYIDPAKYLSPGIKKFTDQIEAGIKKSEDAFASLMDDFDSYVDLSRLSDNQLSTAKNWLVDKKRKYSDIASKLSTMQRTDPKYSELTDELNRIQGAINTFAQQKKAYITNRIQMKDSDFDDYSRVDPKQVENFTSMYKNGAGFTVDETGNMIFKGIDGEDMPFYLSEEPDKKAQDQASAIINLKEDIITKAFSGEKIDQDLLNLKLDAIIKNSQQARSLLQDGVLSDAVINIPEDFNLEKDDKAVVDQTKNLLAKSLMDVYNTKYKPKPIELSATQEKNAIINQDVEDFVEKTWGKTDSINIDDLVFTRTISGDGKINYTLIKNDKESDGKDVKNGKSGNSGNGTEETLANQVFTKDMFESWLRLYKKNK